MRYPLLGEKIVITTWPYDFYGFLGFRNFLVEDQTGAQIVCANSVWVFMDMQKGRPYKIPQEIAAVYRKEEKLSMEYLDRKIPDTDFQASGFFACDLKKAGPVAVPRWFIDTNRHVNNAKYILIAEELLPDHYKPARIRAEYRRPAVCGELLYPCMRSGEDRMTVRLSGRENETYVMMEFFKQSKNKEL